MVNRFITISTAIRGPGLWKFNNALFKDVSYINNMKDLILAKKFEFHEHKGASR